MSPDVVRPVSAGLASNVLRKSSMSKTIYLDRKDVPPTILAAISYTGTKFRVCLTERVELSGAFWDGGSRSTYIAVELATGKVSPADGRIQNPPQFGGPRTAPIVDIPRGVVIVEHSILCGKDAGIVIHAHPADYAPLLPAGNDALSEDERKCLRATRSYKSSYGGVKNYRQAQSGLTPEAWDAAKASLQGKGLLDKRGALTTAGRNAAGGL